LEDSAEAEFDYTSDDDDPSVLSDEIKQLEAQLEEEKRKILAAESADVEDDDEDNDTLVDTSGLSDELAAADAMSEEEDSRLAQEARGLDRMTQPPPAMHRISAKETEPAISSSSSSIERPTSRRPSETKGKSLDSWKKPSPESSEQAEESHAVEDSPSYRRPTGFPGERSARRKRKSERYERSQEREVQPETTQISELEGQKQEIQNQLDSLSRLDPTTRDLGNADARKQIQVLEEELLKLRGVARELVDSFRQSLEQEKQKISRENHVLENAAMNEHEMAQAQSSELKEELLSERAKVRMLAKRLQELEPEYPIDPDGNYYDDEESKSDDGLNLTDHRHRKRRKDPRCACCYRWIPDSWANFTAYVLGLDDSLA
jgi:hypothetical protein